VRNERLPLYATLEKERGTKVITYVTGDRPKLELQIHPEVLDFFVHHLDLIGVTQKITLFLYTVGGSTLASWSIVHLLQQFCEELEVIVPRKAMSGGTLICLGANRIVMTKQAMLGPIDPSVNGPLNPPMQGAGPLDRVPVSVEAINGFIEFARSAGKEEGVRVALEQLSSQIHPLVLGGAYRARAQIRMLAERLVSKQLTNKADVDRVLDFLCSESGSHDYTIFRREASERLKLKIEKPDEAGYRLIKAIQDDIAAELELTTPFDPNVLLAAAPAIAPAVGAPSQKKVNYSLRRGLVESVAGGVHVYVSEGTLTKTQQGPQLPPQLVAQMPQLQMMSVIQDDRTFEGWRHET